MTATTITEKRITLKLFKDFTASYNPSTISPHINTTRVGAYKALQELEKDTIVTGKNYGKARFYTINYDDDYALKNVETLLMEEAKQYARWKAEFENILALCETIVLFGSVIISEKEAQDIDVLIIFQEKNSKKIHDFIKGKNELLLKKIHPLKQTPEDFQKNILKADKVILDALRTGVVLHGYEQYVQIIKKCHNRVAR